MCLLAHACAGEGTQRVWVLREDESPGVRAPLPAVGSDVPPISQVPAAS